MATAEPNPTPNPDAVKFQLDVTLPGTVSYDSAEEAAGDAFAAAVFAGGGVANLFGVNDFVTVTRLEGSDWQPIIVRVQEAADRHL